MRGLIKSRLVHAAAFATFFTKCGVLVSQAQELNGHEIKVTRMMEFRGSISYTRDLDLGSNLFSPQLRYGDISYTMGSTDLQYSIDSVNTVPIIQTFSQAGSLSGIVAAYDLANQLKISLGLMNEQKEIFAGGESRWESHTAIDVGRFHFELVSALTQDVRGAASVRLTAQLWPNDVGEFLALAKSTNDIGLDFSSAYEVRKIENKNRYFRAQYGNWGLGYLVGKRKETYYSGSVWLHMNSGRTINTIEIQTEVSEKLDEASYRMPFVYHRGTFGWVNLYGIVGWIRQTGSLSSSRSISNYFIGVLSDFRILETSSSKQEYNFSSLTSDLYFGSVLGGVRISEKAYGLVGFKYNGSEAVVEGKIGLVVKIAKGVFLRARLKTNLDAQFEVVSLFGSDMKFENYEDYSRTIEEADSDGPNISSNGRSIDNWRKLIRSQTRRIGLRGLINFTAHGDFDISTSFFYSEKERILELGMHMDLQNKNPFVREMIFPRAGFDFMYGQGRIFFKTGYLAQMDSERTSHRFNILVGIEY